MKKKDFAFELPEELIAQSPAADGRDSCKLLVLEREPCERECNGLTNTTFSAISEWLQPGDLLVFNDSKVFPGRVIGQKAETGGRAELLLLRHMEEKVGGEGSMWETMVKTKNAEPGMKLVFGLDANTPLLSGTLLGRESENTWQIDLDHNHEGVLNVLDSIGQIPIPPYIKESPLSEDKLREEYQTVYADDSKVGSAAAPTAGLHFTNELLNELHSNGVETAAVTLHVGLGTFAPVRVDDLQDHKMHSEFGIVSQETADKVNKAKSEGRRVIAVGTTTVRTLESFVATDESGNSTLEASSKWTDIFISPGFNFKIVDGMVTNFHLPESTLLMLVSAFIGNNYKNSDRGRQVLLEAYAKAIELEYRFYSFGDAMLIV